MQQTVYAIGIDLGGTNIKIVLIKENGEIVQSLKVPTDDKDDASPWKSAIQSGIHQLQEKIHQKVHIVGLAAPGVPDQDNTHIVSMPGRLEGLEHFVWAEHVGVDRLPVLNDGVAALIAESAFGAGVGYKNLVLLTLGTGVGGGVLIDGELYQGFFQKAGHVGHMSVDAANSWTDDTHMPGSIELAIGNLTVPQRTYGKYSHTRALVEGYRNGEPVAVYAWMKSVKALAVCLASISNLLSPECILLGGGISQAGKDLFEPVQTFMDIFEWRPTGQQVEIRKARFNEYAGAVGAAAYALQTHQKQSV